MIDINNVDFKLQHDGQENKVGGLFKLDLYKSIASRKRFSKGALLKCKRNAYKVTNIEKSNERMIVTIIVDSIL